ncbi:MAG TPA: hypothetical protein QGG47_00825 [Acidobacteriota bacterium]|nr:hypothetical protein [Acidobacteriota bacterium]
MDVSSPAAAPDRESLLKLVLRIIGGVSLTALVLVVAPYTWMNAIHDGWLGMGELPSLPVVGYLARSTSAFYALLGGLMILVSGDPRAHRSVLLYIAWATTALGIALFFIDRSEGLPPAWSLWEGPFVAAVGLLLVWLVRGLASEPDRSR